MPQLSSKKTESNDDNLIWHESVQSFRQDFEAALAKADTQEPCFTDRLNALFEVSSPYKDDVRVFWLSIAEDKDIFIELSKTEEFITTMFPERANVPQMPPNKGPYILINGKVDDAEAKDRKLAFQLRINQDGAIAELVHIKAQDQWRGNDLMALFHEFKTMLNLEKTVLHDDAEIDGLPMRLFYPLLHPQSPVTWYGKHEFNVFSFKGIPYCDNKNYLLEQDAQKYEKSLTEYVHAPVADFISNHQSKVRGVTLNMYQQYVDKNASFPLLKAPDSLSLLTRGIVDAKKSRPKEAKDALSILHKLIQKKIDRPQKGKKVHRAAEILNNHVMLLHQYQPAKATRTTESHSSDAIIVKLPRRLFSSSKQ